MLLYCNDHHQRCFTRKSTCKWFSLCPNTFRKAACVSYLWIVSDVEQLVNRCGTSLVIVVCITCVCSYSWRCERCAIPYWHTQIWEHSCARCVMLLAWNLGRTPNGLSARHSQSSTRPDTFQLSFVLFWVYSLLAECETWRLKVLWRNEVARFG